MRSLSRPVSRRTVHGVLAGALTAPLVGCDLRRRSAPPTPPAPTADELLVDRVTTRIRTVRAVAAAAAAVPGAHALLAVHDAHLAALGSASPSPATSPSPTLTAPPTNAAGLRAAEAALEASVTDAALRAQDGGLARLLASIAASLAQHVAEMPRTVGR